MSVPFLIVDGYNLLHDAGLARETYRPGELAEQRRKLLAMLARRLTFEERHRCTVVFDAIDAPTGLSRRFRHEEMVVLFAEPGHEADEVVEMLIAQHSSAKNLTVVSSDHRLQNAIRKRRGNGVDSDVFLKQLESPFRNISATQSPNSLSAGSATDVEFWEREFEDVNPVELGNSLAERFGETKSDWEVEVDQLQKRLENPDDLDDWLGTSDSQFRKPFK